MSRLRTRVVVVVVGLLATGLVAGWFGLVPRPALAQAGVWTRQFGTPAHDAATSLALDADGNAYVGGWTGDALPGQTFAGGARDAFVRKYAHDGTAVWTRQFGTIANDAVMDVAVDRAAAVYVVGQTSGALAGQVLRGDSDAFVRKYDSSGTELWTRQFGGGGAAAASRALTDTAGDVYVVGWTGGALPGRMSEGGSDAWVRKYAPDGTELWTDEFGTSGQDRANGLALDGSGAVYVLGQFGHPVDAFVRKYAPDGTVQWTQGLHSPDGEFVSALTVDTAGNFYVGGRTGGDEGEGFARKYAADGAVLWDVEIGRPASASPVSMVTDMTAVDTGVYVAGHAGGLLPAQAGRAAGGFDIFVLKLDQNRPNNRLWFGVLASELNDQVARVAVDAAGDILIAGWSNGRLPGASQVGLSDAFVSRLR
jgi:hypothetical protein